MNNLTKICPFVAKIKDSQVDLFAHIRENEVDFIDHGGNSIKEKIELAGFRSHEAKTMWANEVIPRIEFQSFDPII